MIIHRLLDVFFKTLDTVDAVRDRVDRVRGKAPEPDPWAVDWPPPESDLPREAADDDDDGREIYEIQPPPEGATRIDALKEEAREAREALKAGGDAAEKAKEKAETKSKAAKKTTKKAKKKTTTKKKVGAKKKANSKRKGSVDRSGKDYESPRADAVVAHLKSKSGAVLTEDGDYKGKKVLARVLWALGAAGDAGQDGMTTADISALLHGAAGYEVFATNVGRACRDHGDLIEVASSEGRSKTYRLTSAGKDAAGSLPTRPV
jgi:hypothetical protein